MQLESNAKTNKVLCFVSALIVLFEVMPIFQGYFGAYPELALIALGFLLLFPIKRDNLNSIILLTIICLLFLIGQALTRAKVDAITILMFNTFKCLFVILLPIKLCDRNDVASMKWLFWLTIIAVTITQITTIVNLAIDPDMARFQITGLAEDGGHEIAKLNIGGYAIGYLCPVITVLLYIFKKNKLLNPVLFYLHIALSFVFLLEIQFTLALLLYVVAVIPMLISKGNIKVIITVTLLIIILGLFLREPLANLFEFLSDKTDSYVFSERFHDIAKAIRGNEVSHKSDFSARLDLYTRSLESFLHSPIFGGFIFNLPTGGHSAILDYLATNGIIGLLYIFLAFKKIYSHTIFKFKNFNGYELTHFAQVFYFIYALLNPAFQSLQFWLLFGLSTATCMILQENGTQLSENNMNVEPKCEIITN